jgi:hypothetical protein
MTRFTAQPRALAVGFAFVVYFGLLLIPEWRPGILTTALYFVYLLTLPLARQKMLGDVVVPEVKHPARARRRRLLGAEVDRRRAAHDLHKVRETPRATERRADDPSEGRAIHHRGRCLCRGLRLQQGVTSTAQSACVTLGYVVGPQARYSGEGVIVLPVINGHVA